MTDTRNCVAKDYPNSVAVVSRIKCG